MLYKFVYWIFAIYLNEYVFFVRLSVSPCLKPPAQLPTPPAKTETSM